MKSKVLKMDTTLIDVNLIDAPANAMRSQKDARDFDTLLASIRDIGLIQPITIAKKGDRYEVVAGDRRFNACRKLGYTKISALVKDIPDLDKLKITFDENYERNDVNIVDEALYLDAVKTKLGLTSTQLAQKINRALSYVSERLAILDYDPLILTSLLDGEISFSVARVFARCKEKKHIKRLIDLARREDILSITAKIWTIQIRDLGIVYNKIIDPRHIVSLYLNDFIPIPFYDCFICGILHEDIDEERKCLEQEIEWYINEKFQNHPTTKRQVLIDSSRAGLQNYLEMEKIKCKLRAGA